MWPAITQQLSDTLLFDYKIIEKSKIPEGEMNDCYMISDGEQRYFVKSNTRECLARFEAESENLNRLRQTDTVKVPELVHIGHSKHNAFIIQNFLSTKPLNDKKSSFHFGVQLGKLHSWGEQKEYGFDTDNYIGSTLQPNLWNKKWSRFFSEQRIGWQLQLLAEKGVYFGDINDIVSQINRRLYNHNPKPSLLHGDLWHGNTANTAFGPICYDPASYWGDRECDIAMTELFEGFKSEFYQGYESICPLDFGYNERKIIYNLYHILNHCNLFGGHYLDEAEQIFSKLDD